MCASAWAAYAITSLEPVGIGKPPSPSPDVTFVDRLDVDAFLRGNLHTHSAETDGDVPPADVYRWYRDKGYAFIALTDHNRRIDPRTYAHLQRPTFAILSGEEITTTAEGAPVHVNAICHDRKIGGGSFSDKRRALEFAIDGVHEQGAIALVNHPNFASALDLEDLWSGRAAGLLEIWSGHPYVYSAGVDGRPSHEELWDQALTRGAQFFAVAVDDAHHFATNPSQGAARPGRAWIETFTSTPDKVVRAEVCEAIRAGQFYASNGASLRRIAVAEQSVTVWPEDSSARVEFIGPGGVVLAGVDASEDGATYRLRGEEAWVRVRVSDAAGARAWTQPFRTTPRDP